MKIAKLTVTLPNELREEIITGLQDALDGTWEVASEGITLVGLPTLNRFEGLLRRMPQTVHVMARRTMVQRFVVEAQAMLRAEIVK